MGFSETKLELYVVRMAYMMAMVVFVPNFNAVISDLSEKNHQGQTFGIMSSVYSFASLVVAMIGGALAAESTALPVITGGAIIILSAALLSIKKLRPTTPTTKEP